MSNIDKIAKILAKAEATDNEHEADAFIKAAQMLATKYSIDLALARQKTQQDMRRETPEQREISLVDVNRNNRSHAVYLYNTIANHNDIKINIRHNSTGIIAFGFPSDLDVAEAMFAHLLTQMVESGNAFIKSGAHKAETTRSYSRKDGMWIDKPIDGRVARSNFNIAFRQRIGERLKEAKADAVREIEAEGTGTDLVLASKTEEVNAFYGRTSKARGTYNRGGASGYSSSARSAGDSAGARARLSGSGTLSGARRAVTA